jgi:PKD repeat protein
MYAVTLTVTTNKGCSAVITRNIQITPAPAANFSFSNAYENEEVQFTDLSLLNGGGSVVTWHWNFDDPLSGQNNTDTTQSPVHVFSATGTYQVRLIVINSGSCRDTIIKVVTVQQGPTPMFTYNTACLGSATQFTDTSTPHAASNIEWQWDFGDGSPVSASQNPSHVYVYAGTYPVKLTVKNSNYCSHDTTINVLVLPLPVAGFQTNAPRCHGAPVTYTNTSTTPHGQIVKWVWNFGDGTDTTILYPSVPNVTHTFVGTASQHVVRLTVKTSDSCTAWVEHLIQSVSGPDAAFYHSDVLCVGQNVQFTDSSLLNGGGPITSWRWNFNDPLSGTGNTSTLQNPLHAFTASGTFNVKMVIANAGGCKDSLVKPVIINVLPVANFTFDTVCQGSLVHFTDQSTTNPGTILTWDWDFGDGSIHATVPNPSHLYTTAGPFTVKLTVMNSGQCTNFKTKVVHLSPAPFAAFSNSTENCSGSEVSFIDQSTYTQGYIVIWTWDFGDGHDTVINFPAYSPVIHTYATAGTYNVILTVKTTDSCTASASNVVTVYNPPVANFTYSSVSCQGSPIQFTDTSQPNGSGSVVSWDWDFGDPGSGVNNQSILQNPTHTFVNSGTYQVRLIIHNAYQCYDTVEKTVTISANAFES